MYYSINTSLFLRRRKVDKALSCTSTGQIFVNFSFNIWFLTKYIGHITMSRLRNGWHTSGLSE